MCWPSARNGTTIVVATSGDTGGAAVRSFARAESVDLIVLFPHGRISDVQRRMMTRRAPATFTVASKHLDDCQRS